MADWGYWTEQKLEMLAEYLPRFTTASKRARSTVYLDLFAGAAQNKSRITGADIDGSPRIALSVSPQFSKLVFFELPNRAAGLESSLRRDFPGRDLSVLAGDCNISIDKALADLAPLNWAPTFALIDQFTAEIEWTTIEKLAAFKKGQKSKVELWLLFADAMIPRGTVSASFEDRVTALYGTDGWKLILEAQEQGALGPPEVRSELVNLMRWRLENVLGYARTHAFAMKNTSGVPIYNMIFATDHLAGDKIMSHIYGAAAKKRPQMQVEAAAQLQGRREAEGTANPGLFAPIPRKVKPEKLYEHEPPRLPFGMDSI